MFADTGLGKTRMQLAWARIVHQETGHNVLILAPLAVAAQTVREGKEIGVVVKQCRDDIDVVPGICITNYDRLHRFDTSRFGAVVLDESSIIKHHDAKTLGVLLNAFNHAPFKLCATATPAPNDWTELGTHAEFLGICSRIEMLSEFFVHDGGDTQSWRLKGHARGAFWRWVASWAALVRKPSDLGYDDSRYILPPLHTHHHISKADHSTAANAGMLFALEASTLSERRNARRVSMDQRVDECVMLVKSEWHNHAENGNTASLDPWVIWCDLNAEQDALERAFGNLAFSIRGADDTDEKEDRLVRWLACERPVIISKPSILGFGVNMQRAARVAFVGVTDSFEAYYQAVRRCWRFGQMREVHVHVFASELEGAVVANLQRKEQEATVMADALSAETNAVVREEVTGLTRQSNPYSPARTAILPAWLRSESLVPSERVA